MQQRDLRHRMVSLVSGGVGKQPNRHKTCSALHILIGGNGRNVQRNSTCLSDKVHVVIVLSWVSLMAPSYLE